MQGDGAPHARLESTPNTPDAFSPELARVLLQSDYSLPAFEAAWHQSDGTWVHVAPPIPLVSDWRFRLALSFLLGIGIVIPFAWLAARRLVRPIRELAKAATESRLGVRAAFPEAGPPEVLEASAALSAMHSRVEAQFDDRMRMLVAIAHDLRTPLTALRLRIETTPSAERGPQVGLIRRMERMIHEILDYASCSRREAAEMIDVADLIRSQLPTVDAHGRPIRFSGEAVMARLPPIKLSRVVANLVDNAVRYAKDIEVSVAAQGEKVVVVVADRGSGVAEGDLERIQEPFERIEGSRSRRTGGIGLGLTISRNLAIEMNGALVLENRAGGGLSATVILDQALIDHKGRRAGAA
jgi:signal transduction histidine kinase